MSKAIEPVFRARGITKVYRTGEAEVQALRGIDFDLFRGGHETEVLDGLAAGEEVVLYPSDDVTAGVAVRVR